MRVIFRADASINMGIGLVMRRLILAQELQNQGFTAMFVCRPQLGDLVGFIESKNIEVLKWSPLQFSSSETNRYSDDWLGVSASADAKEFLIKVFAKALKQVKRVCKEFVFTAEMLKGSLAERRKKK